MDLTRKHKLLTIGTLTCACSGVGFGLLFDRSFFLTGLYWSVYESHGYIAHEQEYVNAMIVITVLAFCSACVITNLAFRLMKSTKA